MPPRIFIAMDDTDAEGTPGTGRLARAISGQLGDFGDVIGVSRHQLLQHPRVPYTKNNSANVIHLAATGPFDIDHLARFVADRILPASAPGSDPALCIIRNGAGVDSDFGRRAQTEVLDQPAAVRTAQKVGAWCRSLGGSGDGIIGALAGALLSAGGNDGWFVQIGRLRDLTGTVPVDQIISGGADRVCTRDGRDVSAGSVDTTGRLRPLLRSRRAVVFVETIGGAGNWRVIDPRRSPIGD